MLTLCLSLFFAAPLQLPTEPVSVSTPVCIASTAIAKLSEAAKVPMAIDADVAKEIVYMNVKNRPLSETMLNLAEASCAEWRQQPDGSYFLYRPDSMRRAEERKEFVRKVGQIRETVAKLQKGLKVAWNYENLRKLAIEKESLDSKLEQRTSDEEYRRLHKRIEEIEAIDPINRAMARILSDINPEDLVNVESGQRLVYTLNPTPMQKRLGPNAVLALQKLQEEQLLWGKVLKSIPFDPKEVENGQRFRTDHSIDFFGETGHFAADSEVWQRTKPYPHRPTNLFLAINYYLDHDYRTEMKMSTAEGVDVLVFDDLSFSTYDHGAIAAQRKPGATRIEYSPQTLALTDVMDLDKQAASDKSAKVKLLAPYILDPLAHDPLSFGNFEALEALATTRKKNVVSCLPDETFVDHSEMPPTLEEFEAGLPLEEIATRETPDSLILRPGCFARHWKQRCDRQALAEYVTVLNQRKRIEIDPYVRFVQRGGEGFERYAHLLIPEQRMMWVSVSLPFLKPFTELYDSLSPATKERLRKGEKVLYSSLTARQRFLASILVYSDGVNTEEEFPSV